MAKPYEYQDYFKKRWIDPELRRSLRNYRPVLVNGRNLKRPANRIVSVLRSITAIVLLLLAIPISLLCIHLFAGWQEAEQLAYWMLCLSSFSLIGLLIWKINFREWLDS
ncbi:MAG: hypothetical protein ACYTDT_14120 [Planctomycetota bacterium]|jgi:succinate dehydrogenase/fumarate reductase cytochrome b subunit